MTMATFILQPNAVHIFFYSPSCVIQMFFFVFVLFTLNVILKFIMKYVMLISYGFEKKKTFIPFYYYVLIFFFFFKKL